MSEDGGTIVEMRLGVSVTAQALAETIKQVQASLPTEGGPTKVGGVAAKDTTVPCANWNLSRDDREAGRKPCEAGPPGPDGKPTRARVAIADTTVALVKYLNRVLAARGEPLLVRGEIVLCLACSADRRRRDTAQIERELGETYALIAKFKAGIDAGADEVRRVFRGAGADLLRRHLAAKKKLSSYGERDAGEEG